MEGGTEDREGNEYTKCTSHCIHFHSTLTVHVSGYYKNVEHVQMHEKLTPCCCIADSSCAMLSSDVDWLFIRTRSASSSHDSRLTL